MATGMRRVHLTKRKAAPSPASQLMPPPQQVRTPASDCYYPSSYQGPPENPESVSPYLSIGTASVKPESHSAIESRVKSETRSQSPSQTMASTVQPGWLMSMSSSAKPVDSLINSMVDATAYVPVPVPVPAQVNRPSVPRDTTASDEQLLHRLAAGADAFPFPAADIDFQNSRQHSPDFSVADSASVITPTSDLEERHARQDDAATANTSEVAPLPPALPLTDTELPQRHRSQAHSPSSRTPQPRSNPRSPQSPATPKASNAKASTPSSLYPGPSATMPPPVLESNMPAKKKSRLARSEHPERFLYAGNTFSTLDERAFHETAENNPYLHELTSSATRPVYKTPLEARQALKEAERPPSPVLEPIDYDQQIHEITATIAEFRKKYDKSKLMTAQAGIKVEDNVWDRLANIVQYPPDFDAYLRKGKELGAFAEQMKAWDRAIGHQVIIKKRIVYREAIEKLLVKLAILQTERDLDGHNRKLKRKAAEEEEEAGGEGEGEGVA